MKYTEEEKKSLKFLTDKRDEAYGLMQFEDGEIYQLAEEEFNNYLTIEEIIDKQQKEIEKCKVAFNAQVEALIKMTNMYNNLYDKIKEKIKEIEKLIKECCIDEEHCYEIPLYEKDIEILKELLGE